MTLCFLLAFFILSGIGVILKYAQCVSCLDCIRNIQVKNIRLENVMFLFVCSLESTYKQSAEILMLSNQLLQLIFKLHPRRVLATINVLCSYRVALESLIQFFNIFNKMC